MRTIGQAIDELVKQHSSVSGVFILQQALLKILGAEGTILIDGKPYYECAGYKQLEQNEMEMLEDIKKRAVGG